MSSVATSSSPKHGTKRMQPPPEDYSLAKIRERIPKEYFKQNTGKSLAYLAKDLAQIALFHWIMSSFVEPWLASAAASASVPRVLSLALQIVVWNVFWFFQGLNFTACWVLHHEGGHSAFSPSMTVNELVGFVLGSALLVPYHSWRRTHADHHRCTNNIQMDTVFVPAKKEAPLKEAIEDAPVVALGKFLGMLLLGWPLYLGVNIAGQDYGRRTNHFEPSSPCFRPIDRWGVIVSDVGLLAMLAVLGVAVRELGVWPVVAYYGVPYLWTNAWLVYITFMQHHDVRLPYYNNDRFTFVRGALCTVDRDYGFVNAWLHHINDSHVVHHLFSDMPFYNAIEVTRKYIKPILGDFYAEDHRSMLEQTIESWRKCQYIVPTECRPGSPGCYFYH